MQAKPCTCEACGCQQINQPARYLGNVKVAQDGAISPPSLDAILSRVERRMLLLLALAYPGVVNLEMAIGQATGHRYRDRHNATVHACRLRAKLLAYRVVLINAKGRGYRLEAA